MFILDWPFNIGLGYRDQGSTFLSIVGEVRLTKALAYIVQTLFSALQSFIYRIYMGGSINKHLCFFSALYYDQL